MNKSIPGEEDNLRWNVDFDDESGNIFDKSGYSNHTVKVKGTTAILRNAPVKRVMSE